MSPIDEERPSQEVFNYGVTLDPKPEVMEKFKDTTIKGQPAQTAARVLRRVRRLRRNTVCKACHTALGDKMLSRMRQAVSSIWGRFCTGYAIYRQQERGATARHGRTPSCQDNAEFGLLA